jgi:hypothetical protein
MVEKTIGGVLMGFLGFLVHILKYLMLPVILTVSLTAAYVHGEDNWGF